MKSQKKRKEEENKAKCELVEKLEKLEGIIKENRENMEAVLRQADEYVKGTGEESKIEEVRKYVKINCKLWEGFMSKKIKEFKETGKVDTEFGDMIEDGMYIVKEHKSWIEQGKMKLDKIFQDLVKKLEEEKSKDKTEEETKKVEDIESMSRAEIREDKALERKEDSD